MFRFYMSAKTCWRPIPRVTHAAFEFKKNRAYFFYVVLRHVVIQLENHIDDNYIYINHE